MARVYANLIINQIINPNTGMAYNINDVPDVVVGGKNLREEVLKLINR